MIPMLQPGCIEWSERLMNPSLSHRALIIQKALPLDKQPEFSKRWQFFHDDLHKAVNFLNRIERTITQLTTSTYEAPCNPDPSCVPLNLPRKPNESSVQLLDRCYKADGYIKA